MTSTYRGDLPDRGGDGPVHPDQQATPLQLTFTSPSSDHSISHLENAMHTIALSLMLNTKATGKTALMYKENPRYFIKR